MNLPVLSDASYRALPKALRDFVDYRKSGLSLNHIIGCPMECAYCIRHIFRTYALREPHALASDERAVESLLQSPYFSPHITPIQLLNRATDPFLPTVREHTHSILRMLDARELRNFVLVITRARITDEDCERLNRLRHVKIALLITYSGINNSQLERVDPAIPRRSLETAYRNAESYRVVMYWRPLIQGVNDSPAHLSRALSLSRHAHAAAFTGLLFRPAIQRFFAEYGLDAPYDVSARRKILPRETEIRVLEAYQARGSTDVAPLFRKTSCAVSHAFGVADYNAHYCVEELCDICPERQVEVCRAAYRVPDRTIIERLLETIGRHGTPFSVTDRAVLIDLDDQDRHYLQHKLAFQVQNPRLPHKPEHHGRADVGWEQ